MSVCPHEEVLIYVSRNTAAAADTRGEMGNIIKQPMKGQRWSDDLGRVGRSEGSITR